MEKQSNRYGNYGAAIGGLLGATPSLIEARGEEDKTKKTKAIEKAIVKGLIGAGAGFVGGNAYGFTKDPLGLDKKNSTINKALYATGLKKRPKTLKEKIKERFSKKEASLRGTANYVAGGALLGAGVGTALQYLKDKKKQKEDPEYQSNFDETLNAGLRGAAIGAGAGIAAKAAVPMYYKSKAKKLYMKNINDPISRASNEWDAKKSEKNIFGKLLMGRKKSHLKKVEENLPHMVNARARAAAQWDANYNQSSLYDKLTMKSKNKAIRQAEKRYTHEIPEAIHSMKPFSDYSRDKYKYIKNQF